MSHPDMAVFCAHRNYARPCPLRCFFFFFSVAHGVTLYVANDGNDANSGAYASPLRTISQVCFVFSPFKVRAFFFGASFLDGSRAPKTPEKPRKKNKSTITLSSSSPF
jgi:hypothetical protein